MWLICFVHCKLSLWENYVTSGYFFVYLEINFQLFVKFFKLFRFFILNVYEPEKKKMLFFVNLKISKRTYQNHQSIF